MKKRNVGKRKRKGWRKRSPICTICTTYRWFGNAKGRHRLQTEKQNEKDRLG